MVSDSTSFSNMYPYHNIISYFKVAGYQKRLHD